MLRRCPAVPAGGPTAPAGTRIHHHVLIDGTDQIGRQRLDHADAQAGDQRSGHTAEAAQADNDKGDQRERLADGWGDIEEHRDQCPGDPGGCGTNPPGDRLHAVRPDPHQHGRIAILGDRQQAAAEGGAGQDQVHAEGDDKRQYAGQQARGFDAQAAEVERSADQVGRQRHKVRGEGPEGGISQYQGEAKGAQYLRQHGSFGDVAHQAKVDQDAQHEQQRGCPRDEEYRTKLQ